MSDMLKIVPVKREEPDSHPIEALAVYKCPADGDRGEHYLMVVEEGTHHTLERWGLMSLLNGHITGWFNEDRVRAKLQEAGYVHQPHAELHV